MVVLPSTGASRYHNCCIDGGTSPQYFGYTLVHIRQTVYSKKKNNSSLANSAKVTNVTAQGYILGTLLYLTYTNDLTEVINNRSVRVLFASDTNI
jgi:hypothetical protein